MARDFYHNNVKLALENDGWIVTHDPYSIRIDEIGYEIDFAAEPIIAAEKEEAKIALEVKSFIGPSAINEFHKAIGQFNDYSVALELIEPERILFLAIPAEIWDRFFLKPIIQKSLERVKAKVVTYDPVLNKIVKWIK